MSDDENMKNMMYYVMHSNEINVMGMFVCLNGLTMPMHAFCHYLLQSLYTICQICTHSSIYFTHVCVPESDSQDWKQWLSIILPRRAMLNAENDICLEN